MPASTPRTPSLRRHKPSQQGVVTLNGRDHYLGPWPPRLRKPPPDVRTAYDGLIAQWLANGRRLPEPMAEAPALTVNEVILAFWQWAEQHYRHDNGTTTSELRDYLFTLRPLKKLFGTTAAASFGPLALKAVRQRMIEADLSRGVVNQRIGRIVRMFKWAVSEELLSESTWRALTTVRGLERGRSEARETEPVKPVADDIVDATLPHASPPVRAMIQVQRLTGARPGEVCAMRGCDLDTTGAVWLYRPAHHKTAHRGKARVIVLGPQAQAIVKPFLRLDTQAHLFSPAEAMAAKRAALRATRKTSVQPSQQYRKKRRPKRRPGDCYATGTYGHAIADACDKAFPPPPMLARRSDETEMEWLARLTPTERDELTRWRKENRWQPNRLRHTHGTEVRRRFGLEAAQVALGHSQANVTQVYAERDLALAVKVALEVG
jgi:integrase